MTEEELRALIRCIHRAWYSDWNTNPVSALKLHRHVEALFNYADITDTLVQNNPDLVSPDQFKAMTGIQDE